MLSLDPNGDDLIKYVWVTDHSLDVTFDNGQTLSTPLDWYPTLKNASQEQRSDFEISSMGIHWEKIDLDLSAKGILMGVKEQVPADKIVKA